MVDGDGEVTVVDVPGRSRHEARDDDGALLGTVSYVVTGDGPGSTVTLEHTVVEDGAEGRGVGGALARGALHGSRPKAERLVPRCSFLRAWLDKHPDEAAELGLSAA